MSITRSMSMVCKHCQHEFDFRSYDSINVSENPELKQMVLSKEIFKINCPKCGKQHYVNYPLIYIDEVKSQLIMLVSSEDDVAGLADNEALKKTAYFENYQCRLVMNMHELIEKIMIFDAKLNDRAIETLKVLLLSHKDFDPNTIAGVYFGGIFDEKMRLDVVLKDGNVNSAMLNMDGYEACLAANKEAFNAPITSWQFINLSWGLNYMAKTLKMRGE